MQYLLKKSIYLLDHACTTPTKARINHGGPNPALSDLNSPKSVVVDVGEGTVVVPLNFGPVPHQRPTRARHVVMSTPILKLK